MEILDKIINDVVNNVYDTYTEWAEFHDPYLNSINIKKDMKKCIEKELTKENIYKFDDPYLLLSSILNDRIFINLYPSYIIPHTRNYDLMHELHRLEWWICSKEIIKLLNDKLSNNLINKIIRYYYHK